MTPLIYSLTILKNGLLNDYPFVESINSLNEIVDESFVVLGDSEDRTETVLNDLGTVNILKNKWVEPKEGVNLNLITEQVTYGLSCMRKYAKSSNPIWVIFLFADELFSEEDILNIKNDIYSANDQGADYVRFSRLNFQKDSSHISYHDKHLLKAIRAFRLDQEVLIRKDHLKISKKTIAFDSKFPVFHYGNIRDFEKRKTKIKRSLQKRFDHEKDNNKVNKELNIFISNEKKIKTYKYFGNHPELIHEKLELSRKFKKSKLKENVVFCSSKIDKNLRIFNKLNVINMEWYKRFSFKLFLKINEIIYLGNSQFFSMFFRSHLSKDIIKNYSDELIVILKVSKKNIGIRKN